MMVVYNGGDPVGFHYSEGLACVLADLYHRRSKPQRDEIMAIVDLGVLVNLNALIPAPPVEVKL